MLDLHIALGIEPHIFDRMLQKGQAEGREVRGPIDHDFVRSLYFRDPNGYVIEFDSADRYAQRNGVGVAAVRAVSKYQSSELTSSAFL